MRVAIRKKLQSGENIPNRSASIWTWREIEKCAFSICSILTLKVVKASRIVIYLIQFTTGMAT